MLGSQASWQLATHHGTGACNLCHRLFPATKSDHSIAADLYRYLFAALKIADMHASKQGEDACAAFLSNCVRSNEHIVTHTVTRL